MTQSIVVCVYGCEVANKPFLILSNLISSLSARLSAVCLSFCLSVGMFVCFSACLSLLSISLSTPCPHARDCVGVIVRARACVCASHAVIVIQK